jgi:hypothetical protein
MEAQPTKFKAQWWILFFALVIVFTIAYAQSPLYTSNQNQYFFYGIARSGFGSLQADWLYTTSDIAPVFSWLVFVTLSVFKTDLVFYFCYALIFAIYLFSVYGILAEVFHWQSTLLRLLYFGTVMTILHSAALRHLLSILFSPDWEYLLEGGVAGQRLLGDVFQPSSFGVFLVFSLWLFLKRKPYLAVASLALAATVHPTYLLSAAVLTATYCLIRWRETKSMNESLLIGGLALLLVMPILFYVGRNFLGIDPQISAQGNHISVFYRQPHHMLVSEWLDWRVAVKALIIMAALYLLRKHRLFWLLLPSFVFVIVLTTIQALSGSTTLAMLFPWRFTTVLVPISSAYLLMRGAESIKTHLTGHSQLSRFRLVAPAALLTLLMAVGLYKFVHTYQSRLQSDDYQIMLTIRDLYQAGDNIVVPLKMQEFRLVTGAPIVVEFKAAPHRPDQILQWYERVQQVDHFYSGLPWGEGCYRLEQLAVLYDATHVVVRKEAGFEPDCMVLVAENASYGYYQIATSP